MKKVCFITSHLMSGSSALFDALEDNPRVQGFKSGGPYPDMPSIIDLASRRHKLNNQAAVYMDELLFNFSLQTKAAYKFCKFVYVLRPPEPTLNDLAARGLYQPQFAVNYYCHRLRRMCEMAKRTPGAVFLTWDDLATGRGLPLVQDYLNLKEPLALAPMKKRASADLIPYELLRHAESAFNRYFHYLTSQPLVFPR